MKTPKINFISTPMEGVMGDMMFADELRDSICSIRSSSLELKDAIRTVALHLNWKGEQGLAVQILDATLKGDPEARERIYEDMLFDNRRKFLDLELVKLFQVECPLYINGFKGEEKRMMFDWFEKIIGIDVLLAITSVAFMTLCMILNNIFG